MYSNVSDEFKEKMVNGGRKFNVRLTIDEEVYDSNTIIRLNYQNGDTSKVGIGDTYGATLTFTLYGIYEGMSEKLVKLELGLDVDGEYEYIPFGFYFIRKATINLETTEFTCNDYMYWMDKDYAPQIYFPATIRDVTEDLLSGYGLTAVDIPQMDIKVPYSPLGMTFRETLGLCASLMGMNAFFNRDGNLEYKWYEEVDYTITNDELQSVSLNDKNYVLEYFTLISGGDTVTVFGDEYAKYGITLRSDFFDFPRAEAVFDQIGGFTFRPAVCNAIILNFLLDMYDVFEYKQWKIPIMKMSFNLEKGYSGKLETTKINNDDSYKTPAQQAMERAIAKDTSNNYIFNFSNKSDVTLSQTEEKVIAEQSIVANVNSKLVVQNTTCVDLEEASTNTIKLYVNGVLENEFAYSMIAGQQVYNFMHPIVGLASGSHLIKVTMKGTGTIEREKSNTIIWGNNMVTTNRWNGIIAVADTISKIGLTAKTINRVVEEVSHSTVLVDNETITDTISKIGLTAKTINEIVEEISTETEEI